MSSSYLLDSSVLVLSLKKDTTIRERLTGTITFYTSVVALGERYYGAEHSTHFEKNLAEVNELANSMRVLITDSETARIYGRLKHEQRTRGQMLPDNDLGSQRQQSSMVLPLQHVIITLPGLPDSPSNSCNWKRRY
jgi:tRNA(fMet)-specific endonuclease VapC